MDDSMISVRFGKNRFNYRVGAVIINAESLLVTTDPSADYWYLPGGRVEILEPSSVALEREIEEELGVRIKCGRLLWVVENFFKLAGETFHEIGFYYTMDAAAFAGRLGEAEFHRESGGEKLSFRWQRLDDLDGFPLQPTFLRERLRRLPERVEHFVHLDPGTPQGRI